MENPQVDAHLRQDVTGAHEGQNVTDAHPGWSGSEIGRALAQIRWGDAMRWKPSRDDQEGPDD
jgi:hypothetical protein